jgi:hypothetical protein
MHSDAGNSDMLMRSHKVLLFRKKVGGLYLIRKEEKSYVEVAMIYNKDESSIHRIVKKKKEILASFAIASQTKKVKRDKCLIKMEKV